MALSADPPDAPAAACCDLLRRQRPIQCWVPFGSDLGLQRRKVIKAFQNLFPRTVWTAVCSPRPVNNFRPPLVSKRALPPDGSMASRHHLPRRQRSIFCGMPFRRDLRKQGFQIIEACQRGHICADGAACFHADARLWRGLPLMASLTEPPYLAVISIADLPRRQRTVFRRVPFRSQFGMCGSEIVKSGKNDPPGTDRTTAAGRSG